MKRIVSLLAIAFSCLLAHTARAEFEELFLYWQVSGEDSDFFGDAYIAALMVYEGVEEAVIAGADYGPFTEELGALNQANLLDEENVSLSGINWDNAYFYIELFNEAGEATAASSVISFADIIENRYADWKSDDFHDVGTMLGPWRPTGYYAVPEPTSALLIVFGLAGLALRRRRCTV